jgi:F0F1-type ATP synthase assembly protein I
MQYWVGIVLCICIKGLVSTVSLGLIIGLTYDKITGVIPLFVVLCVVFACNRGLYPD